MGYVALGGFKKLSLLVSPPELAEALKGARWCMLQQLRPDSEGWPRPFTGLLATYARSLGVPGDAGAEPLPAEDALWFALTARDGGWQTKRRMSGKRGREIAHSIHGFPSPPIHLHRVSASGEVFGSTHAGLALPLGLACSQPRRYQASLDWEKTDIRTYDFEAEGPDERPVQEVADTEDGRLWAQLEHWVRANTRPLTLRGKDQSHPMGTRISDAMRPWLRHWIQQAGLELTLAGDPKPGAKRSTAGR